MEPKGHGAKPRIWSNAIRKVATRDPERLERLAEKLLSMADQGDMAALKEFGDRVEGKAVQKVEGKLDHDIRHTHEGLPESLGWLTEMLGGQTGSKAEESSEARPLLPDTLPPESSRH